MAICRSGVTVKRKWHIIRIWTTSAEPSVIPHHHQWRAFFFFIRLMENSYFLCLQSDFIAWWSTPAKPEGKLQHWNDQQLMHKIRFSNWFLVAKMSDSFHEVTIDLDFFLGLKENSNFTLLFINKFHLTEKVPVGMRWWHYDLDYE